MTKEDAELILINGINQTDNSIAEYYKNIAKEKGYSLKVFFDELYNAYERIEKYVNAYEVTGDIYLDENGNEFKNKNVLRLPLTEQTNFEQIDCDNVGYLCRGLYEIAKELFAAEVINILPQQIQTNQLTGFSCNLHPETVEQIFNLMVASKQISGNINDFQAIFANTSTPFKNPVKWLILHNRKPNKTALFTFIKLMLELDIIPRDILRQSNQKFKFGKENIFPDNYTYPTKEEQKSSIVTHFKPIKDLIKKTRPA